MLTIDIENTGDVKVVRCAGRLVRGEAVRSLQEAVVSGNDARVIVLDLSEVALLDAGGLAALVSLHVWAQARDKHLKLVNPSKFVCQMLSLMHLDQVLEISTLEQALEILTSRIHSQSNSVHVTLAAAC
jgi:anti-anti-sigma factor